MSLLPLLKGRIRGGQFKLQAIEKNLPKVKAEYSEGDLLLNHERIYRDIGTL